MTTTEMQTPTVQPCGDAVQAFAHGAKKGCGAGTPMMPIEAGLAAALPELLYDLATQWQSAGPFYASEAGYVYDRRDESDDREPVARGLHPIDARYVAAMLNWRHAMASVRG